jgi:class 3 adenylate cyclase
MREALVKASGNFERKFGHAPEVRGSLHFGAVVVGEIGDTRRDIVFHGDVMNTAARLGEASRHVLGGFLVSRSARSRRRADADGVVMPPSLGPRQTLTRVATFFSAPARRPGGHGR